MLETETKGAVILTIFCATCLTKKLLQVASVFLCMWHSSCNLQFQFFFAVPASTFCNNFGKIPSVTWCCATCNLSFVRTKISFWHFTNLNFYTSYNFNVVQILLFFSSNLVILLMAYYLMFWITSGHPTSPTCWVSQVAVKISHVTWLFATYNKCFHETGCMKKMLVWQHLK